MSEFQDVTFPLMKDINYITHGLTKREYFAGLAMQGLLANPDIKMSDLSVDEARKIVAAVSRAMADSLLAELNK
ncbi:MAG TPA: hypothetical protein V6D19_05420 [Stenomitos sp.]